MDEYRFTQEDVARTVGKSRSAVANTLRLLGLPDDIKELLESGRISAGHARALLSAEHNDVAAEAAQRVVKEGLSVRQTEALVKKINADKPTKKKPSKKKKPPVFTEVELALSEHLGTKVIVTPNKDNSGGTLSIEFYDPAELFVFANKIEKLWNTPLFDADDHDD